MQLGGGVLFCGLFQPLFFILFHARKVTILVSQMKKDCVFCKIINGEIPAKFVYKDKDIIAFKDINPVAPVHILILPVKHVEMLSKTSDKDILTLGKILATTRKLAKKLKLTDFKVLLANGEKAGQTVKHLHFHLIGGWKGSSVMMESQPGGLRK